MRYLGLVLVLLMFAISASSQRLLCEFKNETDSVKHIVAFDAFGTFQSTSISNSLISKVVFGGRISDETIQFNAENSRKTSNLMGIESQISLQYTNLEDSLFKNGSWGYIVRFQNEIYFNASYTPGVFDLIFKGNNTSRTRLDLGPSHLQQLRFQELGFGAFYKPLNMQFGISAIKGQSFIDLNVSEGHLVTPEDVSYLDFAANATFRNSSANGSSFGNLNGMGASAFFRCDIPVASGAGTQGRMFTFQLDNLGFISWSRNAQVTRLDTNIVFNGFKISDFSDTTGQLSNSVQNFIDSVQPASTNETFYTLMPVIVQLSLNPEKDFLKKVQPIGGLRHIFRANYRPLVYAGAYYRFSKIIGLGGTVNWGGYGTYSGGLSIDASLNNLDFYLSSNYLLSSFIANKGGINLNIGLKCAF